MSAHRKHRFCRYLQGGVTVLLLFMGTACLEVETLEDQRRAECDENINAQAFERQYTVTTDCEMDRSATLTINRMEYDEEEDDSTESGVARFYAGELQGESFLTRGVVRVPCDGSPATATLTFPANEGNFVEYICQTGVGNTTGCAATNSIGGNPVPANCNAGIQ